MLGGHKSVVQRLRIVCVELNVAAGEHTQACTAERAACLKTTADGWASTRSLRSYSPFWFLSATIALGTIAPDPHLLHLSIFLIKIPACLRRLPLHFHARPFFQQHQRGSEIEIGVAVFNRQVIDLFHGLAAR